MGHGVSRWSAECARYQPSRLSRDDPFHARAVDTIEKALNDFSPTPQLALVLMSEKDNNIYVGLKHVGDMKKGIQMIYALIPSICIEDEQGSYISNLSLRMKSKLGGVNHYLETCHLQDFEN